jgi:ketosteroid isomerase-like protein
MTIRPSLPLVCLLALALSPIPAAAARSGGEAPEAAEVGAVLDAFHDAAARADEAAYFALLADSAVFLGTDATERWAKGEFLAFARPHFASGKGWRFVPRGRQIQLAAGGRVAWFDELLDSESYGECRGTGVLERIGDRWLIQQYHLTIPVPNELAREVVTRIRALGEGTPPAP